MLEVKDKYQCCGCTACASICNHNAISMKPDGLGFLYPEVDKSICVNCGLCDNICDFKSDYDKKQNLITPVAYAVRHKNISEIETSRSGAAFIALSDWILDQGGVVYGVGYTDHFKVVHKRAVNKQERDEFKGSKYVQSDLNTVFCQIKQDLKSNLIVLFSGAPCQTSGLNSFVGKHLREKLYLVDIVCHGVPGPYIWRDYLDYLERKEGMPITMVNFRDKLKFGWAAHKESYLFNDTYTYTYTYTYTFYQHIMFRRSCSVCHFANLVRPSDVTIADYWGWEKMDPLFNADDKGCSLVLCNTRKGEDFFEYIQGDVNSINVKLEDCLQPNLIHPSPENKCRDRFEEAYVKKGFIYVMKRYGDMGWRSKLRPLKNKLKKWMR